MLCFKCSLKNSCDHLCGPVESYLKSKRNYKTTYVNKEIGIPTATIVERSFKKWVDSIYNDRNRDSYHNTWMQIVGIAETKLTKKQRRIFWMYLDGLSMAEIGRQQNSSGQAVNNAIFGHPKQGGGIVRKIQKLLAID